MKMDNMFNECTSLKELDLSNFNTNNVNDFSYMFYDCSSLEKLDISNFQTGHVRYSEHMFYRCVSLKELKCESEFIKKKI